MSHVSDRQIKSYLLLDIELEKTIRLWRFRMILTLKDRRLILLSHSDSLSVAVSLFSLYSTHLSSYLVTSFKLRILIFFRSIC